MKMKFLEMFSITILGFLLIGCSAFAKNDEKPVKENNVTNREKADEKVPTKIEPDPQKKEILWDFRKFDDSTPNFSSAETNAVLKYLLGSKWDNDLEITGRVQGSFTKVGSNETLYYVGGCDEGEGFVSTQNCAHVSWWNAGKIAIYNGQTAVLKIDEPLGYSIVKVTDVNGDGVNEILSMSGFSNGGGTETGVSIGQIKNGKYLEIESFSGYVDYCDGGEGSKPYAKAAVISYMPLADGKMPEFTMEYFQNKCGNTPWKKITKKQFEN